MNPRGEKKMIIKENGPSQESTMQPTDPLIPDNQYRCFEKNIRMYQLFGFIPEVPPTTLPRRLLYLLPWAVWYWFVLSQLVNLLHLLTSDLSIKGTEVFQRVLENFVAPLFLFEMHYFARSYYKQVLEMRRTFDPDPEVSAQCLAKEKKVLIISAVIVISALLMSYYRRLFFGLEPDEIELVKYYYKKAKPERQLPFIMYIPFKVDDTVAPMYYFSAVVNMYLMVITGVFAIHSNSCILLFTIHINGQFQILAKYLRNFGNPYLFVYKDVNRGRLPSGGGDLNANPIRVIDMEAAQTSSRSEPTNMDFNNGVQLDESAEASADTESTSRAVNKDLPRDDVDMPRRPPSSFFEDENLEPEYRANLRRALATGHILERDCLVFIIRRHQYLIDFRNRLEARLKIIVMGKLSTYIVLTVSLYQLSFIVSHFDITSMQLICQFLIIMSISFVLTLASELLERGNEETRRAAYESNWVRELGSEHSRGKSSKRARKNASIRARLLFILMCERPLRLMYFGGTLELCNRSFVAVLQFCYSVFTLMRQSIHVQSVQ